MIFQLMQTLHWVKTLEFDSVSPTIMAGVGFPLFKDYSNSSIVTQLSIQECSFIAYHAQREID